jgi:hypothetical protein
MFAPIPPKAPNSIRPSSEQLVEEFQKHKLEHQVIVLPCGHYSWGEAP